MTDKMTERKIIHKTHPWWKYWGATPMPACIPNRRYMATFPPTSYRWKGVTCKRCLARKKDSK